MKYDSQKSYIVIDEQWRDVFEDEVLKCLECGYLIVGGVSTYIDEYGRVHYCQALLKSTDTD